MKKKIVSLFFIIIEFIIKKEEIKERDSWFFVFFPSFINVCGIVSLMAALKSQPTAGPSVSSPHTNKRKRKIRQNQEIL